MLHSAEQEPKKIERTVKGWHISLEGEYIRMVTPSGTVSKIHLEQPLPSYALITKEAQVLTKSGPEYKKIQLIGPTLPPEVVSFIKRLKKAIVLR